MVAGGVIEENMELEKMGFFKRIREIRQKTGLNQADFFRQYIQDAYKSRSSTAIKNATDLMKKIEGGEMPIQLQIIQAYVDLAGCSYDALITGKDFTGSAGSIETYGDLLRAVETLHENGLLESAGGLLRSKDPVVKFVMDSYTRMLALVKSGAISPRDFKLWLNGFIEEYDYYLLRYDSSIEEGTLLEYNRIVEENKKGYEECFGKPLEEKSGVSTKDLERVVKKRK